MSLGKMLAAAALVAGIYSALNLALHGVVLDEIVQPAQVIAGTVEYPEGHPHQIYYTQAFSLPNYLAGALWRVVPDAILLSAVRNFLFLFVSAFAPFAITLVLTRKPMWGYLAVALALTEAGLQFRNNYPLKIFPNFASHGHLGMNFALISIAILLARCWRTAGFLIGLLPSVHPAMAVVVWPWSLGYLALSSERPRGRSRTQFVLAGAVGVAVCAALGVLILLQATHAEASPPYNVQGNAKVILDNFVEFSDFHRMPLRLFSPGILVNLIAFAGLGTLLWTLNRSKSEGDSVLPSRTNLFWLLSFGGIAWTCVLGSSAIKTLVGAMPFGFERLMPYRFANFSALLLIPLSATVAASIQKATRSDQRDVGWAAWSALVGGAGLVLAVEGFRFGSVLYRGAVAHHLIFVVWGGLFALALFAGRATSRVVSCAIMLTLFGSVLLGTPRVSNSIMFATSFILGTLAVLAAGLALPRLPFDPHNRGWGLQAAFLGSLAFTSIVALRNGNFDDPTGVSQRGARLHAEDHALVAWLQTHARPNDLILSSPERPFLALKTTHPTLMELDTVHMIQYMPEMAPTIAAMARDLYAIDYEDRAQLEQLKAKFQLPRVPVPPGIAYPDPWKQRTRDDWQRLGKKYGFRLALSPPEVPLQLPVALGGESWNLYAIPPAEEISAPGATSEPSAQH